jgi:hypothetical protein
VIIFLVKDSLLHINLIAKALDDFLDSTNDDPSIEELDELDILEIEEIKKNPRYLTKSYLLERIEPFLLPFYEKQRILN